MVPSEPFHLLVSVVGFSTLAEVPSSGMYEMESICAAVPVCAHMEAVTLASSAACRESMSIGDEKKCITLAARLGRLLSDQLNVLRIVNGMTGRGGTL